MADVPVSVIGSIPVAVRWAANAGYATVLLVLSLHPSPGSPVGLPVADWLAHAAGYGVQTVLVFWALAVDLRPRRAVIAAMVAASLFGAAVEGLQRFQPGRVVELRDVASNTAGSMIAGGLIALAVAAGGSGRRR